MDTKWNLNNIYTSTSSDEFKTDLERLKAIIKDLNTFAKNKLSNFDTPVEKITEYINLKNQLMALDKLIIYLNLASSTDTTNEELTKMTDLVEDVYSDVAYHESMFMHFIKNIDNIEELTNKSELLNKHSYFLKEQRLKANHLLSPQEEMLISKMKSTGSLLWEKQWQQLTSTLTIEYNNSSDSLSDISKEPAPNKNNISLSDMSKVPASNIKNISLSEVRNMAYDSSPEVRKNAYIAELKAYEKIKVPIAFCLNGIKGEVITLAKKRNYASPLQMTIEESRIDSQILDAMLSAIKEALPRLQNYFLIKSKKLGSNAPLPFYNLFAPIGKKREYTIDEAKAFVIKCFDGFSSELSSFAKQAFDQKWLDIMPAKGKVGGAFCETIHSMKESRILLNFGGGFDDVITMAHELGHAYHNTKLFNLTELNSFYPMPIAETASTFCESIVINEALKNAAKEEREYILETDLQGTLQCIIDIYSRFLFEDSVFNNKENGNLSADNLAQLMTNAQISAYGKGLDNNYLHQYMWICKPHYYDASYNYYNFPYAFGSLLSRGLYSMYKDMGSNFIPLYNKLLAYSSVLDLKDVAKIAGIDLYNKDFWLKGLNNIIEEIDEFNN